jgi:hypothetical protein
MTTASPTQLVRSLVGAGLFVVGLLASAGANANITFQFNYLDAAGTGFNDSVNGAARRSALETAGSMFSNMFATHFSNSGTITMDVTGSDDSGSGTLASAGSYLWATTSAAGFNVGESVRFKLQGLGSFPNPNGTVDVNFGHPWQLNPGTTPSGSQFDFYSTMYHEFTHAVGFASLINYDGSGVLSGNRWGAFDKFLTDKNGNAVIDPTTFALNSSVWNAAREGGLNNGLFFNGANAVAANGGNLVPIYSPNPWESGSSGSHVDDFAPFQNMLMSYSTGTGPGVRDYSAVEIGMLKDLGYTPTAVPEPETYAMMAMGLGVLGWVGRRRKR